MSHGWDEPRQKRTTVAIEDSKIALRQNPHELVSDRNLRGTPILDWQIGYSLKFS